MRVFVTGASGWIGSAVVDEVLAAGHQVLGLARSDGSAAALQAKGVQVLRGDLDDLDSIRSGARDADAVIHLANKHDWSDVAASAAAERNAVQAIGDTLRGSGRAFLLASGVAALADGRPATEADPSPFHGPDSPRGGSENLALEFVDQRRAHGEPALRADRARHRRPRVHRLPEPDRARAGCGRLPGRRHEPVGCGAPQRRRPDGRARPGEGTGR